MGIIKIEGVEIQTENEHRKDQLDDIPSGGTCI